MNTQALHRAEHAVERAASAAAHFATRFDYNRVFAGLGDLIEMELDAYLGGPELGDVE